MSVSPKVSVLVPIYNVEKHLKQCLDSLKKQTLKQIEFICIDDGSTDSSPRILAEYAAGDRRFKVITKKNTGYGDSMNKGLAQASGEYIGILESDDYADADMFQHLYQIAEKTGVQVVKSNYVTHYDDKKKRGLDKQLVELVLEGECGVPINPQIYNNIIFQRPAIWTAIYSRSFLKENNIEFLPSPGASYQDTSFSFKVWACAEKAYFTKKAFLHYRLDNENSSVNSPGKTFCVKDEYDEIERFLKNREMPDVELKKHLEIMRVCRWGGYRWNIERLTLELAEQFIKEAHKQHHDEINKGDFNYERFDFNQRWSLQELIETPEHSIARKKASEQAVVTVVVPVSNTQKHIKKCLTSITEQSYTKLEVIVVDDGSTDGSLEIAESFAKTDPRINLVFQPHRGVAAARNTGMEKASGDYLTFCDDDDYLEKDAIERLVKGIQHDNVQLSVGAINMVFQKNTRTNMQKQQDIEYYRLKNVGQQKVTPHIIQDMDLSLCNKLFQVDLIEAMGLKFPDGLLYEDAYFVSVYLTAINNIYFLKDKAVYNYVRRPKSIMHETFQSSNRAIDHLRVGILIYYTMKKIGTLKNNGPLYLWYLRSHLELTRQYTPIEFHDQFWYMIRRFILKERPTLVKLDKQGLQLIENLVFRDKLGKLNKYPHIRDTLLRLGILTKKIRDTLKYPFK